MNPAEIRMLRAKSGILSKHMTPAEVRSIRNRKGWSQTQLAAFLRIKDIRTVQRWETGDVPISGPASILLELLDAGELPERFL